MGAAGTVAMRTEAFYALPYPPSANKYWYHTKRGEVLTEKARAFRHDVWGIVNEAGASKATGRLEVSITLTMPDNRKRDIDNVLKALLDALQHAGAYADDNQIDLLSVQRDRVESPGAALVFIRPLASIDGD
jgi:crossover junction endodeoxyribonuclease RusA